MEKTGLCETDFLDGETCTKEELLTGKAVNHFHSYIRRALKEEREGALDAFVQELFRKNPDLVIVSTELGYGIVPIDAFDRLYREKVGRILCKLWSRRRRFTGSLQDPGLYQRREDMRVVLIRHSKTAGNLKGRYIGTTDEPLCEEGIRLLEGKTYPAAELVYVSPMKRCRETASLIYPTLTQREEPLLR